MHFIEDNNKVLIILTPKVDPILKLSSNTRHPTKIHTNVFHTQVHKFKPFLRDRR